MTEKFAALRFEACPVVDRDDRPIIKCAVLQNGAIRLSFNATAFEKFNGADKLHIAAATGEDGAPFLRLSPATEGWPLVKRQPGGGARRQREAGRRNGYAQRASVQARRRASCRDRRCHVGRWERVRRTAELARNPRAHRG